MTYIKLFLLLATLLNAQTLLAMTMESDDNEVPELVTEFGNKGKIDGVDPKGKWVSIDSKRYILNGIGSLKSEDLRPGLNILFNVERAKGERNGRVTKIWLDDTKSDNKKNDKK